MASKPDSTGGATPSSGKAAQARAEVGGVRNSEEPVPDLWFGQPTEERRDATCSSGAKRREGRGDGPRAPRRRKGIVAVGGRASYQRQRMSGSFQSLLARGLGRAKRN